MGHITLGESVFGQPSLGDVKKAVDRRHQGRRVALVDASLGQASRQELQHRCPFFSASRLGRRCRHCNTLLNIADRPFGGWFAFRALFRQVDEHHFGTRPREGT